jgi:hypothetical protein
MSQALAAARKRRAPQQANEVQNSRPSSSQSQSSSNQNVNNSGLTLPQVINVIDSRIITLEKFMKDTKEEKQKNPDVKQQNQPQQNNQPVIDSAIIDEYNTRFELLAEEINNIKDIVLKLQAFTMDVNKTLLEERVNVFSELGSNLKISNNDNLSSINLKTLVEENFST